MLPQHDAGWLWKFDESAGSWRQLWSVLQGHALLCYDDSDPMRSPAGGKACASPQSEAYAHEVALAPPNVNLERPCHVLWLAGSQLLPASDSVAAPSAFTFTLHSAATGMRNRLCTNTEAQRAAWRQMLAASGVGDASRAPSRSISRSASPPASPSSERLRRAPSSDGASVRDEGETKLAVSVSNW